jgi:hypothetical protein
MSASFAARSRATQHITFEETKCRGSPRASQMPWSGSLHKRTAHSACDSTIGQSLLGRRWERHVEQDRVENGAEDVVLALGKGAVADPHWLRPLVAGQLVAGRSQRRRLRLGPA